jgi:[ribosomal protein S5]-alanine N-acetyltransferase
VTKASDAKVEAKESRRARTWPARLKAGIETERLVLRGLVRTDYQSWRSGYAGRYPARTAYDHRPVAANRLRRKTFDTLVSRHARLAARDQVYVLAAFTRRASEHIGTFDLATIRRPDVGWANVGYVVHNQHQRRGFGREALTAVLRFGLDVLGFHRIEAAIRPDNDAAIALARAAGMEYEAIRRSFWLDEDGWADHAIFVVIAA